MAIYEDAHLLACANAITALGNTIALYSGTTRVGTVSGTTIWGTPVKATEDGFDWGKVTGSSVTISVPGGTVANGTTIDRYGVISGSTLLRTEAMNVSVIVSDGSQAFSVDVTPIYRYRGQ